jgi:hypothetical protein
MNKELEEAIVAVAKSTAILMGIEDSLQRRSTEASNLVDELSQLKLKLEAMGGEDTKQKPLSKPVSEGYPPNKYRALAQLIISRLSEKKHISIYHDFVGSINEIELLIKELEDEKLLAIHEYMSPLD